MPVIIFQLKFVIKFDEIDIIYIIWCLNLNLFILNERLITTMVIIIQYQMITCDNNSICDLCCYDCDDRKVIGDFYLNIV